MNDSSAWRIALGTRVPGSDQTCINVCTSTESTADGGEADASARAIRSRITVGSNCEWSPSCTQLVGDIPAAQGE